ncbi:histidine phosphatase family protein [Robinsoniella peoriensis]|uniref:histidine phosphatase family protein n=1 Tax=Robinsoniella peoriensis TaxID=180332 RepID=UPI003751E803
MNGKVIFYVTRHGQTLFNLLDKVQGWSDTPLTQQGIQTANLLGNAMKKIKFESVYTSDSGRACETATLILNQNEHIQPQFNHDKRLREWGFGSLEGESNNWFMDTILNGLPPDIGFEHLTDYLPQISEIIVKTDTIGFAEPFGTIENRISSFFKDIAEKVSATGGGQVLIVTHAFIIKTIVYLYARHRISEVAKVENASITKIIYQDGNFCVEDINSTSYTGSTT